MWFRYFVLLSMILFSGSLFAETWYIKSYKVNPTLSPGGKKMTVRLIRGTQVAVIGTQKNWRKVSFNGQTGWVHRMALSQKPPRKRVSLLVKKVNISSKARKRASSFTSAAAARGLMDSEESNLNLLGEPDFIALSKMISRAISLDEATQYMNQNE